MKLLRGGCWEKPFSCLKSPSLKTFILLYPLPCSSEPLNDHVPASRGELKCSRSNGSWIWKQTLEWESGEARFEWPWASHFPLGLHLSVLEKWMIAKATDSLDTEGFRVTWVFPLEPGMMTTCTSEPTWGTCAKGWQMCLQEISLALPSMGTL